MNDEALTLDPARCVMIIIDMQNDVIIDGGAFAETGSPQHAEGAEHRREREGPRGDLPEQGRPGDPRLEHRRGGRDRL